MKYVVPLKNNLIMTDDYEPFEDVTSDIIKDLVKLQINYPVQILYRTNLTIFRQLQPPYKLP